MSRHKKTSNSATMLDLWRPPRNAGDPIGCLATTYTFSSGFFEEQCLARFLEIDAVPHREDLAFLLERETRLGSIYAGVLVDHTKAGVEHSLRWDVLPVRIHVGKQHAKLSLLAWTGHIRIIVASANLTAPGYRTNQEVSAAVDLTPAEANAQILAEAVAFLRNLLLFMPGAAVRPPEIQRAEKFLDQVERQAAVWKQNRRAGIARQQLVFTHPAIVGGQPRSSLDDAVAVCRRSGGSPHKAWIASPFFDTDKSKVADVTKSLCKLMARGGKRELLFCVPAVRDDDAMVPRLAAPQELLMTPKEYQGRVAVKILPECDSDKNRRPWHAKMLALFSDSYSALMIGSSNFTCFGMGVTQYRNAEANLLTIVNRAAYGRDAGQIAAVWPEMEQVADPELAEWLGTQVDQDEEEVQGMDSPLPTGFLSATYRAGDQRSILLRFDSAKLPEEWCIIAKGWNEREILSANVWKKHGSPSVEEIAWIPIQPPEKLLVQWNDHGAFLPLNVEDSRKLPPPAQLQHMTSDDMLWILAAANPSAALRAWVGGHHPSDSGDHDLDSATPIDLDPLRRYDLQATFLHRIRRRARILGQLRSNLQRPVWGRQALDWRLRGFVGIEALADRMLSELTESDGKADEALLALADFLMVIGEVDYQPSEGSLPKAEFEIVFRPFLKELSSKLGRQIDPHRNQLSGDLMNFWKSVVKRCQE